MTRAARARSRVVGDGRRRARGLAPRALRGGRARDAPRRRRAPPRALPGVSARSGSSLGAGLDAALATAPRARRRPARSASSPLATRSSSASAPGSIEALGAAPSRSSRSPRRSSGPSPGSGSPGTTPRSSRSTDGRARGSSRGSAAAPRRPASPTPPGSPRRARRATCLAHGETGWTAFVCERLGGARERVRSFRIEPLAACADVDPLNVLVLVRDPGWRPPPVIPFLPEAAFSTRGGLVTKREVQARRARRAPARRGRGPVGRRARAPARSRSRRRSSPPRGASSRSSAIPRCSSTSRGTCCATARTTCASSRAPRRRALEGLEAPDAVFVGGSGGDLSAILARALDALRPGGRLVVNAALLDTLEEARRFFASRGLSPGGDARRASPAARRSPGSCGSSRSARSTSSR